MSRGTTYEQLIEMVRDETAISSNTSRGMDNLPYIQRLIKRYYETLCDNFDWAFLRVDDLDATKAIQAGERYYDFPVAMDIHDTIDCYVFWGNVWLPLEYGIGPLEYSAYNSDVNSVRADPILKWKIRNDRQFEVWPIPASTGAIDLDAQPVPTITSPVVRFTGRRRPTPLVNLTDRCDMDDQVLVLHVAAEILAKQKSEDAPIKLAAAKERLAELREGYSDRRVVRIGMGEDQRDALSRGWPRIRVYPATP